MFLCHSSSFVAINLLVKAQYWKPSPAFLFQQKTTSVLDLQQS